MNCALAYHSHMYNTGHIKEGLTSVNSAWMFEIVGIKIHFFGRPYLDNVVLP